MHGSPVPQSLVDGRGREEGEEQYKYFTSAQKSDMGAGVRGGGERGARKKGKGPQSVSYSVNDFAIICPTPFILYVSNSGLRFGRNRTVLGVIMHFSGGRGELIVQAFK